MDMNLTVLSNGYSVERDLRFRTLCVMTDAGLRKEGVGMPPVGMKVSFVVSPTLPHDEVHLIGVKEAMTPAQQKYVDTLTAVLKDDPLNRRVKRITAAA
jgi:hypothetical protein